jgi:hypothetical protein
MVLNGGAHDLSQDKQHERRTPQASYNAHKLSAQLQLTSCIDRTCRFTSWNVRFFLLEKQTLFALLRFFPVT